MYQKLQTKATNKNNKKIKKQGYLFVIPRQQIILFKIIDFDIYSSLDGKS